MRSFVLTLFIAIFAINAHAAIIELSPKETRFVAMRANKVNARSGPNMRYPIEWIYQQQNYPVEIIAEYEQWRKIRDHEGTVSWVMKNLLTNARYALVTDPGENNVYDKDSLNSEVIARAEDGAIGKIKRCTPTFCLLQFENNIEGWMSRNVIYGVKKDEEIK